MVGLITLFDLKWDRGHGCCHLRSSVNKSTWSVKLPEEVQGMPKDDANEQIAEYAISSEKFEYGDIL